MTSLPFEYCGHKFVSKYTPESKAGILINAGLVTQAKFIEMNLECLTELLGSLDDKSEAEIRESVEFINVGGTQMLIEYAGKA